ncbi:MAG: MSMEG_1061 family FMN-dependent PPOX-type flavoprotein, partial [bacterium]
PKGDPPGFVKVIDDKTLLIPDRRGNRRVDSMMNIVDSPGVGIIFFVPGVEETLRVNGEAEITTDPALLAPLSMKGKCPEAGLLIRVREAYFHCGKSIIRSKLWDPETRIERSAFPTLGRIVADQVPGRNVEEEDATTERVNRENLY